jgi:hypothetical protein
MQERLAEGADRLERGRKIRLAVLEAIDKEEAAAALAKED